MITYKQQVIIDKEEAESMQMEIDNYLVCIEQALDGLNNDQIGNGLRNKRVQEIKSLNQKIRNVSDRLWKK